MNRQGSCNLCGQCCGAEGSPYQKNPWPKTWPDGLRTWQSDDLPVMVSLVGSPNHGGNRSGAIATPNGTIRFIWIEGLCKDLPPYGKDSNYSLECPFLLPDPGDGTRPCALVGTPLESIWTEMCQSQPPLEKTPEEVAIWQERHPGCSFSWE